EDTRRRFWLGLLITLALVWIAEEKASRVPGLESTDARFNLGLYMLLGLPFFYLLVFSGDADEAQVEGMGLCSVLGVGLQLLNLDSLMGSKGGGIIVYLIVGLLYFIYTVRVLPGLRVFKHTLRGYSYMNLDRLRLSIQFFRRAIELDPNNQL